MVGVKRRKNPSKTEVAEAIKALRGCLVGLVPPGVSLSKELIAERRAAGRAEAAVVSKAPKRKRRRSA